MRLTQRARESKKQGNKLCSCEVGPEGHKALLLREVPWQLQEVPPPDSRKNTAPHCQRCRDSRLSASRLSGSSLCPLSSPLTPHTFPAPASRVYHFLCSSWSGQAEDISHLLRPCQLLIILQDSAQAILQAFHSQSFLHLGPFVSCSINMSTLRLCFPTEPGAETESDSFIHLYIFSNKQNAFLHTGGHQ